MSVTPEQYETIKLVDPRTAYSQPPFKNQAELTMPGSSSDMNPTPDHGEKSYEGSGKLKGLNALITGGDSGIGRAVATCFAREGANVAINFLSETKDAETSAELVKDAGVKSLLLQGDLRTEETSDHLVQETISEFGSIDILVNNAAYQQSFENLDEMSTEVFDRIFKTNVYAPFWLTKAAIPHLPAGGSVINTVSIQGYSPSPYLLPYATSKSAMLGMTKAFAKIAIEKGIRVNAVAPGPVWTPFIPGSMPKEKFEKFGSGTLFERPAQPIELAPLYVWLASPSSSYVTAEVFGCTGGKSPV